MDVIRCGQTGGGKKDWDAMRKIPAGFCFEWAGKLWLVPAVFFNSREMIVELCFMVPAGKMERFFRKWRKWMETPALPMETVREIDRDNPLSFDFRAELAAGDIRLKESLASGALWYPPSCNFTGPNRESQALIQEYGCRPDCGWAFFRLFFPKNGAVLSDLSELTLRLTPARQPFPALRFRTDAHTRALSLPLTHPVTGKRYDLAVHECSAITWKPEPGQAPAAQGWEFPSCCFRLSYTLEPPAAETSGPFQIRGIGEAEPARRRPGSPAKNGPRAVSVSPICGGSGEGGPSLAFSPLRFSHPKEVWWEALFWHQAAQEISVQISLPSEHLQGYEEAVRGMEGYLRGKA